MHPSSQVTKPQGPDESALVRAVQEGDRVALERLLMRAQEIAYRFSRLVCGRGDDAEDAMQEALLKTFRHAARIREPAAFRTWLYRTVKNACLISRRRRVGQPSRVLSLDELGAPDRHAPQEPAAEDRRPDQELENRRLGEELSTALAKLPEIYRLVVVLRDVEGLSTREVAEVTGVSEANVKTRLHRARLLLRNELKR